MLKWMRVRSFLWKRLLLNNYWAALTKRFSRTQLLFLALGTILLLSYVTSPYFAPKKKRTPSLPPIQGFYFNDTRQLQYHQNTNNNNYNYHNNSPNSNDIIGASSGEDIEEIRRTYNRAWRCVGGIEVLQKKIESLEMKVWTQEPGERPDLYSIYVSRTCEKAAKRSWLPNKHKFKALRVERWEDYANGINGFIDFQMTDNVTKITTNYTAEYSDDDAHPMKIHLIDKYPASNSRVVFITAVWNRAKTFIRLLDTVEEMSRSGDDHFAYCFIDWEDDDLDVERELNRRNLMKSAHATVIKFPQPFRKSHGLQACIDRYRKDDIIFIMDVDLKYSPRLLDITRRYVVSGRRLFSPIVYYEKGSGPEFSGWAIEGTGIIAMYKRDIDRFGGYDLELFKEKYGFEDTDFFFAGKSLGLQVARRREPELLHLYHTRDGWSTNYLPDLVNCYNP